MHHSCCPPLAIYVVVKCHTYIAQLNDVCVHVHCWLRSVYTWAFTFSNLSCISMHPPVPSSIVSSHTNLGISQFWKKLHLQCTVGYSQSYQSFRKLFGSNINTPCKLLILLQRKNSCKEGNYGYLKIVRKCFLSATYIPRHCLAQTDIIMHPGQFFVNCPCLYTCQAISTIVRT